jgi:hypothetical protein
MDLAITCFLVGWEKSYVGKWRRAYHKLNVRSINPGKSILASD